MLTKKFGNGKGKEGREVYKVVRFCLHPTTQPHPGREEEEAKNAVSSPCVCVSERNENEQEDGTHTRHVPKVACVCVQNVKIKNKNAKPNLWSCQMAVCFPVQV